ncbi:MAG TPA: hypothetical protein VGD14_19300 [bacterium]
MSICFAASLHWELAISARWIEESSPRHPLPQREDGAALLLNCCVFKVTIYEPGTMNLIT